MLDLESILQNWKNESVIDDMKLDQVTVETSRLHGKYLEFLQLSKLRLKKLEKDLKKLRKNKLLWYAGKLSKAEMDALGWGYDPLGGLKIMKSELGMYVDADEDVLTLETKRDYQETICETLLEILEAIKWRHQSIKNVLEWKKFAAGC